MPKWHCNARGCTSSSHQFKKLWKYPWMKDITFHPFPTKKKPELREKWIQALQRDGFEPNKFSRLCSRHFIDGKPTTANPVPALFQYNGYTARTINIAIEFMKRSMYSNVVGEIEVFTSPGTDPSPPKLLRKSVASSQRTSQVKISELYGDEVALEHAYHHSALDCTSLGCQEKFHTLTERIKALENHVSSLENEIRWLQYISDVRENESDVTEEKNIHSDNESGVSLQKENICSGNQLQKVTMMEESTESRKPEKNGYFCKMCWKSFSPDDVCAFEGGDSASEMSYICDLCDSLVDGLDDMNTIVRQPSRVTPECLI